MLILRDMVYAISTTFRENCFIKSVGGEATAFMESL